MKKQSWKMHFYKGVPCRWDGDRYDEEKENYIFEADLYISGYERGCSSAVMLLVPFKDKNKDFFSHKFHYRVFMSDIEDIVKGMVRGRIKGSFTWVKKGSDYGIQLVKVTNRKNGNAESFKKIMKQIILRILMMICGITIAGIVLYWLSLLHWSIAVIAVAIVATGILGEYIK